MPFSEAARIALSSLRANKLRSFLTVLGILIGVSLIGEGFEQHIPKGYIYFAMGFSVFVEMINLRVRGSHTPPVKLHTKLPG